MSITFEAPEGEVRGTDQDVFLSAKSDAPSFVLSYDELLDARDTSLACLWPLQHPPAGDQEDTSKTTRGLTQQTAHSDASRKALHPRHDQPSSLREAGLQQAKHQRRIAAPKLTGRQSSSHKAKPFYSDSSNLQPAEPDSSTDDNIHTAHFSDEGELSDAAITSKQPRMSAKHRSIRQEPVVLYTGPSSKELAASRAASKPPSGPRPRLGDVLLEAIHSDDVKRSSQATGALEEPLSREKWQCIMRLRQPDGQLVECGYENLWYMRQCAQCDATHGAIELAARVSAILQTCDSSSISASQVMNRLKAFSRSPGGLGHAFTMDMVLQAIKDWSLAQGCEKACPSGPSAQNQPAVGLLSTGQDQAQVKAVAGCEPAASFSTTALRQQAGPVDEQWGRSAAVLRQALTTLATSRATKRPRTQSSLAPDQHTPGTQQTQRPSSENLAEGPVDAPALPPNPVNLHIASGSALQADAPFGRQAAEGADNGASHSRQVHARVRHVGAPEAPDHSTGRAQMVETCMGPSEQGVSGQALHFAHDLLDAVMRQQHKHTKSSKKKAALGQWVQVRRPSAYGQTRTDQHRKVFQLPALPQRQPKRQSWQRPPAPTLSIHYPPPPALATHPSTQPQALHPNHHHQAQTQQLAEARGPEANPSRPMAAAAEHEALGGAAEETLETQEAAEQSLTTSAQDTAPQDAPVPLLAASAAAEEAADKATGDATAAEAADPGRGLVEEPHYASARGLRPNPVARALAGPTVHILLEGYDVYTESGMKRKGHDFPLQEGLRVSQDSRQLWLHQQPFKLKRATPQDVAEGAHRRGGWRQKQGSKVNTRQIALDRQQAVGSPCSIGASGHPTAFQPFSHPSGLHPASAGVTSDVSQPSDRAVASSGQQISRHNPEAMARQEQGVSRHNASDDALAAVPGQELQAAGQAGQSQDEARANVSSPDRTRAGPGDAVHHAGAVGAADMGSLQAAGDTAMAEQFRELGGDAWKVFYMASKMGLRPDIIDKAAHRLRSLQQQPE